MVGMKEMLGGWIQGGNYGCGERSVEWLSK
jgi:hypothetical protein